MKRIFAMVIVAMTLASCGSAPYTKLYYTDFTRYADEGVFVTPFADYSGHAYTPISDFTVEHYIGGMGQEETNFQGMADALVNAAKSVGANGVMNFKVSKVDFTWFASGTAVHFTDMPNTHAMPNSEVDGAGKPTKPATPQTNYKGDELIKRTVAYCIEREIEPFGISNKLWNNTTVYDLNAKRYIDEELYNEKYGENASDTLYKAYKAAEKAARKKPKK